MVCYFIGVDVGTASVRAGLFDENGRLVASSTRPSIIWTPLPNFYEQSSDNVWESCCFVVKKVMAGVDPSRVKGIGFDATCSLVVLGQENRPLTVSPTGRDEQNVVMWMDHRAERETEVINAIQHPVFKYVGGKVSIEMQLPKLLWLKNHLPNTWRNARKFMDLPDFLTWKATDCDSRSQCSVVCKWNYVVDESSGAGGWSKDLLRQAGLEDLLDNGATLIENQVVTPGNAQGRGLSRDAATEMGLIVGTPVGVSLIDAYAGALGLLACRSDVPVHERLALICGTSACHMLAAPRPVFVDGVWGPYADVLLPGMWLLEGGQSAVGKLLDHVVETHPSCGSLKKRLPANTPIQDELYNILKTSSGPSSVAKLAKDVHVWPDFHGNRSPLADPGLKGMICGLTLDSSEYSLALLYLATIQAICYGTRHIIDAMRERQAQVGCMLLCGGLVKSELFVTTLAEVTGVPVVIPHEQESVLLGSAIAGASASGQFASVFDAMGRMGNAGQTIQPQLHDKEFHDRKYRVFLKMVQDQKEYNFMMNGATIN